MYFDSARNAYIDRDTGEVVFQEIETGPSRSAEPDFPGFGLDPGVERSISFSEASPAYRSSRPLSQNKLSGLASLFNFSGSHDSSRRSSRRLNTPTSRNASHQLIQYVSERELELSNMPGTPIRGDQKVDLEDELFNIHVTDSYDVTSPTEIERDQNPNGWDDWTLARALQALEFEIPQETNQYEDFNNKEYRASKSCRRQFLTISFVICVVQIALLITMCQMDGTAPQSENSAIGPPAYSLVRFGAKESALIVWKNEYWRLLSSIMLHAGVIHIVPNVAIQLRIGGYLNLVYGTPKWLFIYIFTGIFGELMSCLIIPDSVGVGSSGALMGLLGSWVVWIIFRWNKIPPECKAQRNCQLFTVVAAIVVTLATSFMPAVDYAAHAGGAFQGILWGIVLLGSESEDTNKQMALRFIAAVIALVTYAMGIYYLVVKLKPSKSSLAYWETNDDWHR